MYSDTWSKQFLIEKLQKFGSIQEINSVGENLVKITRKKGIDFIGFTMSMEKIDYQTIKEICDSNSKLNFITNIKKQYCISSEALTYLEGKNISFGGLGDFMRFCNKDDNELIEDKEFSFVSRGLRQHIRVTNYKRLDNRRIKISRLGLPDVIGIMINDYDISIESVRSAKDLYDDFKVIIKTNPNGKITSEAEEVANHLKIEICKWGDFLGKLNSQWT